MLKIGDAVKIFDKGLLMQESNILSKYHIPYTSIC